MKTTNFGRTLRNLVLAGAVAAASAGALAAPALARDWDDHSGQDGWRHEGEWRDRDDRRVWVTPGYSYGYAYNPYGYYYAPAPVYAPPVVSFGFSFR